MPGATGVNFLKKVIDSVSRPIQYPRMDEKELRLIEYALCFLVANWDEDNADDLDGMAPFKDIEKLSRKYMNLVEENNSRK